MRTSACCAADVGRNTRPVPSTRAQVRSLSFFLSAQPLCVHEEQHPEERCCWPPPPHPTPAGRSDLAAVVERTVI